MRVGEPVLTSSGSLPCKAVIHVAGPRWPFGRTKNPTTLTQEEILLSNGVTECLKLANQKGFRSLAIPAISTGVFGFPVELAARCILAAVAQFCQLTPVLSLQEISLTNHDQTTCDVFQRVAMENFSALQVVGTSNTAVPDLEEGECIIASCHLPVTFAFAFLMQ